MKQLIIIVAFVITPLITFSQNSTITNFTFNHLQGLSETNQNELENIYFEMNDNNFHSFSLVNINEKTTYQYPRLLAMAKQRAIALQDYYITQQGVDAKNVKIVYGSEYPTLLLHKPKAQYTASGDIVLEEKYQQCYNYNSAIDNTIYTDNGNTFLLPPNAFETLNGNIVSSNNINVCIWEFSDKKSLVYANLTTHSGDKMLETGGSFYIKASLNGEELRLSKGTKYTVNMITEKPHKDMFTYYGNIKDGIVNWDVNKSEPAYLNENTNSTPQIVMMEDEFGDPTIATESWDGESESEETFYQLTAGKLGWINCDRFYEVQNTSVLAVKVDSKEPVSVRIVFRDINSVLPCYASSNHSNQYSSSKIPTGEKVLLLAYSVKGDNAMLGYKEVIVGENSTEVLSLNNLSKRRFESAVSELLSY